jgi:hypothetical protein
MQRIAAPNTLKMGSAAACAPSCSGRRPAASTRPAGRRAMHVAAARKAPISEADLYVGMDPTPPAPPPKEGAPWYVAGPLGFAALIAVLRTAKAISRRRRAAGGSLEERNLRGTGVADDAYYSSEWTRCGAAPAAAAAVTASPPPCRRRAPGAPPPSPLIAPPSPAPSLTLCPPLPLPPRIVLLTVFSCRPLQS